MLLFTHILVQAAEVDHLRCEYLVNPIGVDAISPRLSWQISSLKRGDMQRAFQIMVSSTSENLANNNGDMWNTGKTELGQSVQMEYRGKTLHPNSKYYWKVILPFAVNV